MLNHTFIGLDVHAASVVGCALVVDTGELVRKNLDLDPAVVLDWVRHFKAPVKAVYESGPTGYVLARFLREAGIDCVVAASSKLLRAPGDKIKTDVLTELPKSSGENHSRSRWASARFCSHGLRREHPTGSGRAGGGSGGFLGCDWRTFRAVSAG